MNAVAETAGRFQLGCVGRGGGERWAWRRWAEGMAEGGGRVQICIKKVTWAPPMGQDNVVLQPKMTNCLENLL